MTNWTYDDTEHLSIAYSLFHGEGLSKQSIDLEAASVRSNIPALQTYDEISIPLRSKPPIYLVVLGAWLVITNASYNTWSSSGISLNLIFVLIFITIFYFFVKRQFGIEIAAYSTPLVVITPIFLWFSVRVRPEILLYVFMIATIYFASLKISYRNVAITGLLSGLCHLVHPVGYLTAVAYLIYLILKGKFRYAIVLVGTWAVVIAPWMVRNYIVFGDVNQGFGLPIPKSILAAIRLISPSGLYSDIAARSGDITSSLAYTHLDVIAQGMLDQFTNSFGMQFFMLFIAFSIFAYVSFPVIKRKIGRSYWRIALLVIMVFLYVRSIQLVLAIPNESGLLLQLIFLVLIPFLIFLYFRRSSHRDIFATKGQQVYYILAILAIISFIPFIMWTQITYSPPEVRIIVASLYLVIPLAVIGIRKIVVLLVNRSFPSFQFYHRRKIFVSASMIGILVIFSYAQLSAGIGAVNTLSKRFSELEYQKDIHEWIKENIPPDAKIASDRPHAVLLRTGHESVNFQPIYRDNVSYERWIIKKFDIDYIVVYAFPLLVTDLNDIQLQNVYEGKQGGFVHKIIRN